MALFTTDDVNTVVIELLTSGMLPDFHLLLIQIIWILSQYRLNVEVWQDFYCKATCHFASVLRVAMMVFDANLRAYYILMEAGYRVCAEQWRGATVRQDGSDKWGSWLVESEHLGSLLLVMLV